MGPFTSIRLASIALLAALLCITLPAQQRSVLPLAGGGTAADVSTLVLAIKSFGQIQEVEADATRTSLTVSGTPEQIALAKWLVSALDRPEGAPAPTDPANSEYSLPDRSGLLVKVFYHAHAMSPEDQRDLVNAIRSMADIRFILPFGRQRAICMRGTAPEVQLAEWLINELGKPANAPDPDKARWREYPAPVMGLTVRLFFLPNAASREEMMNKAAALHEATGINRICPVVKRAVLAASAKPEQLEIAESVIYQRR